MRPSRRTASAVLRALGRVALAACAGLAAGACHRAPAAPETEHVVEEGGHADGRRTGVLITRYPDGALAAMGSFLMGDREGVWIFRAADGTLDEDRTGVYESGERVAPWFEEGTRSGRLKSGMTQQATYEHGLRNGLARGFHPDGSRESEGSYEDGLRTGPWTYWLPTGELDRAKSGVYRLDVKVEELEERTDR